MGFEKDREKALKWEKLRAKGKPYMMARAFVMGAIIGAIYPLFSLLWSSRTEHMPIAVLMWSISFGLLYVVVGFFAWGSNEKHYQKFMNATKKNEQDGIS